MSAKERILGFVFSAVVIIIIFFTSIEFAVFDNTGFYEKEYLKYSVLNDVDMDMNNLMSVTEHMLDYLRGYEESLDVRAIIDGKEQEFFNEKEKSHMADVKKLFEAGYYIRDGAFAVFAALALIFWLKKMRFEVFIPKCFIMLTGVLAALFAALGAILYFNFNKIFTLFHKIFFNNDLWILDPATDRLINIVPEGFFADMTLRIGIVFIFAAAVIFILSCIIVRKQKANIQRR